MDEHPIPDEWRIPDDLWEAIAPLLPEHKNTHRYGGGRPRKSDRVCLEAILFVLRTGCQWKAGRHPLLPRLDGPRPLPGVGRGRRLFDPVGARPDGLRRLEGDRLGLAEYGRLHDQGAPRGKKTGKNPTDRAKKGTKRSLLVEAEGIPVGLAVEGANRPDMKMVEETLESIPVERPCADGGRPAGAVPGLGLRL